MHYRIQYTHLAKVIAFKAAISINETRDGKQQQSYLSYDLRLEPLKKTGWGEHGVRIVKTFAQSPANPADAVVQRQTEPLLELEVLLDREGQPVKLHNYAAIWQRWMDAQEEITRSYRGEWVEEMVSRTESILLQPEALLETAVRQDWVLGQYFAGVYSQDFHSYQRSCRTTSQSYYFLGPNPLLLQEHWQYQSTPDGCDIRMEGAGKAAEADSRQVLRNVILNPQDQPITIHKQGNYQMNKASGWCSGYHCTHILSIGESYGKQISIKVTSV